MNTSIISYKKNIGIGRILVDEVEKMAKKRKIKYEVNAKYSSLMISILLVYFKFTYVLFIDFIDSMKGHMIFICLPKTIGRLRKGRGYRLGH